MASVSSTVLCKDGMVVVCRICVACSAGVTHARFPESPGNWVAEMLPSREYLKYRTSAVFFNQIKKFNLQK